MEFSGVFGRWTVVEETEKINGRRAFLCNCSCGNTSAVLKQALLDGSSKSCGCLKIDSATKHGMYGTRIYGIWMGMKSRCQYPKHVAYHRYGGRGIELCKEWNDFNNFYNDMKGTYEDWLEIDRIDNNGNYCKENCKWSTEKEQSNNRSDTIYLTHNGVTETTEYWSKVTGIPRNLLRTRRNRGWSDERSLSTYNKK